MNESSRTLWVGNLSQEVDNKLLFELFLQAGPIDKVTIPMGPNGYSRGYGFVTFQQECSVLYAIAVMKGITLFGKQIVPQMSLSTDDETPKHKKRASLQDMRRFHLQSVRSPHPGMYESASQGYHIPVLGASSGPSVSNDVPVYWSGMIPTMPQHRQDFVPPCPQYMVSQFYKQDFRRTRTDHDFQYYTGTHGQMESPLHSTPMMPENNLLDTVPCDHNVSKGKNVNIHTNDRVSSQSLQGRQYLTVYDQRRLQKK